MSDLDLMNALSPLVAIADAYDANELDNEARRFWGPTFEERKTPQNPEGYLKECSKLPEQIELYSGRGGKQLLTLADCFAARKIYNELCGLKDKSS